MFNSAFQSYVGHWSIERLESSNLSSNFGLGSAREAVSNRRTTREMILSFVVATATASTVPSLTLMMMMMIMIMIMMMVVALMMLINMSLVRTIYI